MTTPYRALFLWRDKISLWYTDIGVQAGCRRNDDEEDGQIISRETIERSIDGGYAAWCEIEKLHPEVEIWETVTPYFETRNIHFYVNRYGFHIVEFYNEHHPDPNDPHGEWEADEQFPDGMFRFEKIGRPL